MSEAVSEKIGNVSLMTLANDINELSREISLETVVYIGNTRSPKISAWCLQNQPKMFVSVSSDTFVTEVNPVDVGRILMQRFYLIEKAKDAERVGIVLGSNGGHATSGLCMDKLRKLGQESGKTVYSLSKSHACEVYDKLQLQLSENRLRKNSLISQRWIFLCLLHLPKSRYFQLKVSISRYCIPGSL